jgi:proline iminopeptidase
MTKDEAFMMKTQDPLDFLYPETEAEASGLLNVGDGHQLWWEACGNPAGVPVIYLHGGPGGATSPNMRRYFDPSHFRYVTIHQRGCGQSTPLAETQCNTTQTLIADIERLRIQLNIARWLVVGGSWGTALGIAYGESHPDSCLGFVLAGVTLGRDTDRHWWWHGTPKLFPEAFDAMIAVLPEESRSDPMAGFHTLLMNPDKAVHLPAARAICLFSAATVGLSPDPAVVARYDNPDLALPLARLFLHYSVNRHFLQPNQLLNDLSRIRHLPCAIQSSRYDVTTPPEAAWTLHKAWPGSTFNIVGQGAHSLSDPAVAKAFLDTVESMKVRI